jgi:hypothetical protein
MSNGSISTARSLMTQVADFEFQSPLMTGAHLSLRFARGGGTVAEHCGANE